MDIPDYIIIFKSTVIKYANESIVNNDARTFRKNILKFIQKNNDLFS